MEGNVFMEQWNEYLEALASKAPTPGGGSAAAVYGAIGTALGEMVGNLTSGKKKFAIYEEDVQKILARLGGARMDFIRLEKADEQAFQPLSEVYRMKAETKEEKTEKEERMEECLKAAAKVPMEVMERAVSVMDDIEFLALHGSRLAVSDAGVGIQGIRSALLGAVMSVYINTKMMKDREYAEDEQPGGASYKEGNGTGRPDLWDCIKGGKRMITLKGAEVSAKIKEQVLAMNGKLGGYVPTAAIVRIGERPDDLSYERNVMKRIAAYGMETMSYVYPADITEEEFFAEFQKINDDEAIDGILLFRPLPKYINEKRAEQMIRPEKDLDGICAVNTAKVFAGEKDGFAPCTAEAVIEVLKAFDIPMEGKRAVIVGRSMVVGRPLSMLMLKENATVTVCHTKTKDLKAVCREADILVAAAGKAKMLDASFLKEGAVLIDVGINVDENGKLCGDVLWEGLEEKASAATPVPGGVGAVTTAVLAKHLAMAAERKVNR